MLKLMCESTVIDNPTLKLNWVIDADTFNWLRDNKIEDPHLLIVVYNHKAKAEERYLYLLEEAMCFLPLNRAGKNTVHATIVWERDGYSAEDIYLRKDYFQYHFTVLTSKGAMLSDLAATHERASKVFEVPQTVFPKKPKDWEWVKRWHKGKAFDQCEHRKWRILAYTVQPPAVFFAWIGKCLFRLLGALISVPIMLLFLRVPNNWAYLNPIDEDSFDIIDAYEGSGEHPFYKVMWLVPFRPAYPVIAFLVVCLLGLLSDDFRTTEHVVSGLVILYGCFLVTYLVIAFTSVYSRLDEYSASRARARKIRDEELRQKKLLLPDEDQAA